jgi:dTDP-4-amino-4,6-dideoxygalactose transaminase
MIRLVPPLAVPYGAGRIAASLLFPEADGGAQFSRALARASGADVAVLFGSGRAALASFLGAARRPGRDEVLVPAYTCWSVPASVVRAGFRVRLIDVDPRTLVADLEVIRRVPLERVAAIVLPHAFAYCGEVRNALTEVAHRDLEVLRIEDAAQAWPVDLSPAADALILSFARGKPLPLGGGGALIRNSSVPNTSTSVSRGGWTAAFALTAVALLARPAVYRIPRAFPFLGIGTTVYDPGFDVSTPFLRWQASLGLRLLPLLPEWNAARTRHAAEILAGLGEARGWTVPLPARGEAPTRLPLLAPSVDGRARAVAAFERQGISAATMYPAPLGSIPELRPHLVNPGDPMPGTDEIASRLFTLPVYPTLSARDVEHIARTLGQISADIA